ncbi:MAG: prepilin-type N-terminal cleavage/methylation domain-containing protein [Planctomycetota bacterium]
MRKKIKAFTLIELLVVISIIALLLLVLMPALGKTRYQSRRILCASNLKTIGMGDIMYSQESDDWHVPVMNGLANDERWFENPLFTILVDLKGRHNEEEQDIFEEEAMTLLKDFKCPNDKRTIDDGFYFEIEGLSYGMNGMGLYGVRGWHYSNNSNPPPMAHCLKTSQVVSPGSKFFFMDAVWYVVHRDDADYKRVWDVHGDRMGPWAWDAPAYRHDEGANMLFYDGHVNYLPKEEIYHYPDSGLTPAQAMRLNNQSWLPIPDREYIAGVPWD